MKRWIGFPRVEGKSSRQAHADLPNGTYEREIGREGFFGPATHMYHAHPPTGWSDWQGPLKPRAFDTGKLPASGTDPWQASLLFRNAHLAYRIWHAEGNMRELARNGDGDELLFLHSGKGELFCDYGHATMRAGDYFVIPRGTMWRIEFPGAATLLLIEATNGSYRLPDKGLLGPHAIFDPAVLEVPRIDEAFLAQQTPKGRNDDWQVHIKRGGRISTVTYPYNPLDAVGWHGDLAPVRLNVEDIRPVVSHRYHLPPSVHTTFLADRFVICTFAPRPLETDPGALKIPFFHSNDDFDEVIFYHRGEFISRDDIKAGMVTLHPAGFPHGPHPKALGAMLTAKRAFTDEYAVMLDARDALEIAPLPDGVENENYVRAWSARGPDPWSKPGRP
jgi:homogentisate 1,2-dioxygenase